MTILPNTVTIEQGLENWQIFQQTDGFTDISFSGRINCDVIPDNLRVYARIVHEETMLPVVDWIPVVREGEE